jgi:hypothetical protein
MEDTLLRDDSSDQNGDQQHDRDRLPTDPIELIRQRGQPQRFRPAQHTQKCNAKRTHHLQECGHVFRRADRGFADFVHLEHDRIPSGRWRWIVTIDLPDLLD